MYVVKETNGQLSLVHADSGTRRTFAGTVHACNHAQLIRQTCDRAADHGQDGTLSVHLGLPGPCERVDLADAYILAGELFAQACALEAALRTVVDLSSIHTGEGAPISDLLIDLGGEG
jgi:hypothetical protein